MKKLFVLMSIMALACTFIPKINANKSLALSADYEQCTYFQNVSASITESTDGKSIRAYFQNGNDNKVMVFWEIKAYNSKGDYVTIGSGQTPVNGGGNAYGYWIRTEGYSGWGIKIYNCKK